MPVIRWQVASLTPNKNTTTTTVQAVGTLIFLFLQSWKLSLVAFVSVPAIVVISRVYVHGDPHIR